MHAQSAETDVGVVPSAGSSRADILEVKARRYRGKLLNGFHAQGVQLVLSVGRYRNRNLQRGLVALTRGDHDFLKFLRGDVLNAHQGCGGNRGNAGSVYVH